MRVVIVTHDVIKGNGQGRVNYELTRYLLNQGVEVGLVADQVAEELLDMGAKWHPAHPGFDSLMLLKVWRFRHMADRVLKDVGGRYDVVMACGVVLNLPHTVNVVHFVHRAWLQSGSHPLWNGFGINPLYQGVFAGLNAHWEKQIFQKAEVVVGVSEQIREELIWKMGLPSSSVKAIVNGVDVNEFSPGAESREKLGLPKGPVAFFAGDIQSSRKNLDTVLRALANVPNLQLAVAGETAQSRYPDLAETLGLSQRTHFLGFRRDIPALMRAADFFVFPSRYEACTLVLLEAMASGLPVVTAKTAGGAELVKKDCGFVLDDPEDAERLSHYMHVLADDEKRRRSMGQVAREVAEQHSWRKMAQQYLALFKKMRPRHENHRS